jgi:hypothetical protein
MVRDRKRLTKFLTKDQVKECLTLDTDPSHQILFHLMVRTGLRSCEARSFPLKYVFNPRLKKGLRKGQMISVALDPSDMHIKYDRLRNIDVPWSLMESMWSYSLHQREVRKSYGDGRVRVRSNPVVPMHQVMTDVSVRFLSLHVAHGRYPFSFQAAKHALHRRVDAPMSSRSPRLIQISQNQGVQFSMRV